MKYKNVVWDWNGTLLHDVNASLKSLNMMLEKRSLNQVSLEQYRGFFGFPVRGFYEDLGFDFNTDDWDAASQEYVDNYDSFREEFVLTEGIMEVLSRLKEAGVKQYILSALFEENLKEMQVIFNTLPYLSGISGCRDIYADGKVTRGKEMLEEFKINPKETLMVGDTLHDAEVAEQLGFDVVLFSGGHNSPERLKTKGRVINKMEELLDIIL